MTRNSLMTLLEEGRYHLIGSAEIPELPALREFRLSKEDRCFGRRLLLKTRHLIPLVGMGG